MIPIKSRAVWRYFEPADTFVRIVVCDAAALDVDAHERLNRAAYRRRSRISSDRMFQKSTRTPMVMM